MEQTSSRKNKRKSKRPEPDAPSSSTNPAPKKTKLQEKFAKQLAGARFRQLNESMYTSTGAESQQMLSSDSSAASAYHTGFAAQVAKWPTHPLDTLIQWAQTTLPAGASVADFGCGEARFALELSGRLAVHSFDLAGCAWDLVVSDFQ